MSLHQGSIALRNPLALDPIAAGVDELLREVGDQQGAPGVTIGGCCRP